MIFPQKKMYDGAVTSVKCADRVTGPINVTRGVKQADPLSPALFNLVLDELHCSIDQDAGMYKCRGIAVRR